MADVIPRTLPRVLSTQYRQLLEQLDAAFRAHAAAIEDHPCRRGCDACCHGPFDVGVADIWTLTEALAGLPSETRKRVMTRVTERAAAEREALKVPADGPIIVDELGDAFDAMCDAHLDAPCVFLEDGACVVYDDRPEPCRLTGANWESLEMPCPISLTDGHPTIALDIDEMGEAIARLETRLSLPVAGQGRTTIALGVDAVLRSWGA